MNSPDSRAVRPDASLERFSGRLLRWLSGAILFVVLLCPAPRLFAQAMDYQRPVEAAPNEQSIGGGYVTPEVQRPLPRAQWREITDVALLAVAMAVCAWLVLARRSRRWLVVLAIGCLLYFGLYREGCVCPIGAIQNVVLALADSRYVVSYLTIAIFLLPLTVAVLFGRVFCGGVCPLGAIQELVLLKPVQVPRRLDKALGWLKWVYLALAVWFAAQPAEGRDFIICRFDPFVGFFRFTGPLYMLLIGGGFLVLGLFVGRAYCRYLCPYGALLSLVSRLAWRGVTVTPDKELDCGLCEEACPYGAIEGLRAVEASCLACARCYRHCPRQHVLDRPDTPDTGAVKAPQQSS